MKPEPMPCTLHCLFMLYIPYTAAQTAACTVRMHMQITYAQMPIHLCIKACMCECRIEISFLAPVLDYHCGARMRV